MGRGAPVHLVSRKGRDKSCIKKRKTGSRFTFHCMARSRWHLLFEPEPWLETLFPEILVREKEYGKLAGKSDGGRRRREWVSGVVAEWPVKRHRDVRGQRVQRLSAGLSFVGTFQYLPKIYVVRPIQLRHSQLIYLTLPRSRSVRR